MDHVHVQDLSGLKKNQNTPRPSEHPPVMGEKMSKRLVFKVLFVPSCSVLRFRETLTSVDTVLYYHQDTWTHFALSS